MQAASLYSAGHDPFSLFHNSPLGARAAQAPDGAAAGARGAPAAQAQQQPAYQLFGGGGATQRAYPLAPLLPVGL
jgi:hypothetical protein